MGLLLLGLFIVLALPVGWLALKVAEQSPALAMAFAAILVVGAGLLALSDAHAGWTNALLVAGLSALVGSAYAVAFRAPAQLRRMHRGGVGHDQDR